ncbi:MAG: hypothetical protein H6581_05230 [Bacteroidia bacterium]|nr:hypothetical protein [Bacteroidia bacterium]
MKYYLCLLLAFISQFAAAQDYHRLAFRYAEMEEKPQHSCSDPTLQQLDEAMNLVFQNKSKSSVLVAKKAFQAEIPCPYAFEVYAWCLFRSANWERGQAIIDSAIYLFGPNPDLVLRRAYMNLEMGEMGPGTRNIDGMALYLPPAKRIPAGEKEFTTENYRAALADFKYLADTYEERFQEIYAVAYLYQQLEEFENSNEYLEKLLPQEKFQDNAILLKVENLTGMKKFEEARSALEGLEKEYPRNSEIQKQFVALFQASGNTKEADLRIKMMNFFSWVPPCTEIPFSEKNYAAIQYFTDENPPQKKISRLEKTVKKQGQEATDLLLTVLDLHANHGNGVEEKAESLLTKIGPTVVPKVIALLDQAKSTCTVTRLASILADIKDPRGWQPLVDYLPKMAGNPLNLPPDVPSQLIKFDRKKALPVLLSWIREENQRENPDISDDPLENLPDIFGFSSKYGPLKVYEKREIAEAANLLRFSLEETTEIIDKVFGKE